MKIEIGKPIKVAGEKWILADASAKHEDGQTVVFLQLTPYIKDPHLRPVPRKRWTIYIHDEENQIDPVAQLAEEAIALIEDMKVELQQLKDRRLVVSNAMHHMTQEIQNLELQFDRAQERLRRRVRVNPYV